MNTVTQGDFQMCMSVLLTRLRLGLSQLTSISLSSNTAEAVVKIFKCWLTFFFIVLIIKMKDQLS